MRNENLYIFFSKEKCHKALRYNFFRIINVFLQYTFWQSMLVLTRAMAFQWHFSSHKMCLARMAKHALSKINRYHLLFLVLICHIFIKKNIKIVLKFLLEVFPKISLISYFALPIMHQIHTNEFCTNPMF